MPHLKIHSEKIDQEVAKQLVEVCPFSAIEYNNNKIEINAGCKMCQLCVKKGPSGAITFEKDAEPEITVNKDEWRGVTVFVEHQKGEIHNVTLELIGKARELASAVNHPVYAIMMGYGIEKSAEKLLEYGVDTVFVYDDKAFENFLLTPYSNAFTDFVEKIKPSSILVGATNIGRSLAPRIAARFRAGLTADCTILEMKENTDLVQIRPAFGGNIMAQIINPSNRPQLCTVRYKIFPMPEPVENPTGEVKVMTITEEQKKSPVEILEILPKAQELDLSEAEIIVAVGRGVKSQADLQLVEQLADTLGAQIACTRPLIENGWFGVKRQIGLSGRTVNAKLIFTVGISGSVQFTSGMSSSDCIVAINNDKNASIFDIAHYGIVGDLYEVIPAILAEIKQGDLVCATKN